MGGLCSKQDKQYVNGGHQVLGSSQTTGNAAGPSSNADARQAAAEAAEKRLKESRARGTHASNPNQGKLAAKANKPAKFIPEPAREAPLVWD